MDADLFWHFYILLIFLFESPCEPDSFTWIKLVFVVNGLAGSDAIVNTHCVNTLQIIIIYTVFVIIHFVAIMVRYAQTQCTLHMHTQRWGNEVLCSAEHQKEWIIAAGVLATTDQTLCFLSKANALNIFFLKY